jgi:subtilisin family serine protease
VDAPCDDEGHGTHVAGIVVANAVGAVPAIGVAPGARWIAAKACKKGEGCTLRDLLEAAQFMLAPTTRAGADPDPSRRPHVLNNSWELDHLDSSVDRLVKVWEAADIQPVFAAGNTGPQCESVGEPSSVDAAMSVGALDGAGVVLPSSGRGPGANGVIKPDLVAPGEAIVSTVPGGGWAEASGTSVAAPHVTGLVVLALSAGAAPDKADDLLMRTAKAIPADGCGTNGQPNNITGWGLPDAPALVAAARPG